MGKSPPREKVTVNCLLCQCASCLKRGKNEYLDSVGTEIRNVNPHNVEIRGKVANTRWLWNSGAGLCGTNLLCSLVYMTGNPLGASPSWMVVGTTNPFRNSWAFY